MSESNFLEAHVVEWIKAVGIGIEAFGVLAIVFGIVYSTFLFVTAGQPRYDYDAFKIRIGRSLLLGLELLVAADIIRTVALELTFSSLGLLAGLVLVRTFLSWTLVLEIEGRWPWQPKRHDRAPGASNADGEA